MTFGITNKNSFCLHNIFCICIIFLDYYDDLKIVSLFLLTVPRFFYGELLLLIYSPIPTVSISYLLGGHVA